MLSEKLKEYFSFTKKERTGALILIFLIIIVFILPHLFPSSTGKTDPKEFARFKSEWDRLQTAPASTDHEAAEPAIVSAKPVLFYFDPNNTTTAEWKRLGLSEKMARTIEHYLSKGGRFRKAEDLANIYGMSENQYRRLLPYVRIKDHHDQKIFTDSFIPRKKIFEIIDINTADTSAFIALPGIGSKLASRIVNFREKLGGFYSVDQIAETYGLADSVYQKIKPFLKITKDAIRQIDINNADVDVLKSHPYIRWKLANVIIRYRQEHGPFKSLSELSKISLMDATTLEKISPYLKTN